MQFKKVVPVVLVLAFFVAASYYIFQKTEPGPEVQSQEMPAPPVQQNDLPEMTFLLTDSSKVVARQLKGKTVIVLFQPDCDHCQREATEIRNRLEAFRSYHLYFVSSASLAAIRAFAQEYQLADQENVSFGYASNGSIVSHYGLVETPSLYIYSDSGRLVRAFNGETALQNVVPYL